MPPPTVEQTFTVTNLQDSGAGSLQQAVPDANANAGNDTIDLQGLSGTVTLTGELRISESVTITGAGANLLNPQRRRTKSRLLNLALRRRQFAALHKY